MPITTDSQLPVQTGVCLTCAQLKFILVDPATRSPELWVRDVFVDVCGEAIEHFEFLTHDLVLVVLKIRQEVRLEFISRHLSVRKRLTIGSYPASILGTASLFDIT